MRYRDLIPHEFRGQLSKTGFPGPIDTGQPLTWKAVAMAERLVHISTYWALYSLGRMNFTHMGDENLEGKC